MLLASEEEKVMNTNGATSAQEETKALFENGAARSQVRPRYDLIPLEAMLAIAERFTYGLKYGKDNWKRGGPAFFEDAKNHAIHHMMAYAAGDDSEETSEQNLGAALWNLAALCWWERTGRAAYEKAELDREWGEFVERKDPSSEVKANADSA